MTDDRIRHAGTPMTRVLAITDATDDVDRICRDTELLFFQIRQLPSRDHDLEWFETVYRRLRDACDLSTIDVVIAEYIESLPLLYFMRRDGYRCPALMIPHTNPYPLNILCYFLLVSAHPHPDDLVVCGSANAVQAYEHIVDIPAASICTFGIKDIYRRRDQADSRARLGLPPGRPILLYTGRFMNDKGLEPLLAGYRLVREHCPDALLAMSTTHVDVRYHNRLAAMLENVVTFQWLDRMDTVWLYNSADVYVSGATSIFETYGKAPLEALACGVPVVVPRWDGFPSYVNESNGALVEVEYGDRAWAGSYDFARMRVDDFAVKCRAVLDRGGPTDWITPAWADYDSTIETLSTVVAEMAGSCRTQCPPAPDTVLDRDRYPRAVLDILDHYHITSTSDILVTAARVGLINRRDPGDTTLLRALHHSIFSTMTAIDTVVSRQGPAPVGHTRP